jgi:hypothetical protein
MKILKIIGIVVGAIVIILAGLISAIFPHLNNLEKFVAWSPWSKMDPAAKNTYEGAAAGVGAKMRWDGPETGKGTQWIIESVENERVKTGLTFEGFDGESNAEFKLTPESNGTKVVWSYDGPDNGFLGKAFWLVMGSALNSQYEDGLNDLKKLVESQPVEVPASPTPADSTTQK